MKKHRREKKMFKVHHRFSTYGGRTVKLSNMIELLNPPVPMEEKCLMILNEQLPLALSAKGTH